MSNLEKEYVFACLHRMLQTRFMSVTPIPDKDLFDCKNRGIRHFHRVLYIDQGSHYFYAIDQVLIEANKEIKDSFLNYLTLFLVVPNTYICDLVLKKIEDLKGLDLVGTLSVAPVVKSSRTFGPLSIHESISVNYLNS